VLDRLDLLETAFAVMEKDALWRERSTLPAFFKRAFHHGTLLELLFLRRVLSWRRSRVDSFIAALILGSLHGEMGKPMEYLSNQMPRTISTKPGYSLRYWRKKGLWPHRRHTFQLIRDRAEYRLGQEVPDLDGVVRLADARESARHLPELTRRVKLVITSPPYLRVTRYEEDQWLRLWFLGFPPHPTYSQISKDDRHESEQKYWTFLTSVWAGLADLLSRGAVIVCRFGACGIPESELTRQIRKSVRTVFPHARLICDPAISNIRRRQTGSFRPGTEGCRVEVDYVFATS